MGPDFALCRFDNGAGGAFENGAGSLHCPKIPVFVVFRRSLARTSYETSFVEISFFWARSLSGDGAFYTEKSAGKVVFGRVSSCGHSLFSLRFLEPFREFLAKNRVFWHRAFWKRGSWLKIGSPPKRGSDNFCAAKKKNGTFSRPPLPDHGFSVCRCRTKTDETTVNVVYSVLAPKTNFCRRLLENRLFPMFQPRGAR